MSLKIKVNDEKDVIAELEGRGSFSVILNAYSDDDNNKRIVLNVTGISSSLDQKVSWINSKELHLGDKVIIEVTNDLNITPAVTSVLEFSNNQRKLAAYEKLTKELRSEGLID